jgi:hypothetical protein
MPLPHASVALPNTSQRSRYSWLVRQSVGSAAIAQAVTRASLTMPVCLMRHVTRFPTVRPVSVILRGEY